MNEHFFSGTLIVEQFDMKGGWHYAVVPLDSKSTTTPFGWKEVTCTVDEIQLGKIKLMPMGDGRLFLPLKKSLREQLNKQKGDTIQVEVYFETEEILDTTSLETSISFSSPDGYRKFKQLSISEQNRLKNWILTVKLESARMNRILLLLEHLEQNKDSGLLK